MTLTVYAELLQGSDEWLEARRGLLTASVIGTLITPTLKVADNDKSRGLTAALVAERITGWVEPTWTNDDMQRGHDVEPIARDWYAEREGVEVAELGFMVRTLESGHRVGWSPDGLVGEEGSIEIKAPRPKGQLLTHLSGEIPHAHLAQMQTGLLVSGRQWCDYIAYTGGLPPFVKRVHRDQQWAAVITQAVANFETKAAEMRAEYEAATKGLVATERMPNFDELVI